MNPTPPAPPAPAEFCQWKELRTVEDVCAAFPDRIAKLLQALDLDRPELATVKNKVQRNDLTGAVDALLEHFRSGKSAAWLRCPPVSRGETKTEASEKILNDEITSQGVTGKIPRHPGTGSYEWRYSGPHHDPEFAWFLNRHLHLKRLLSDYSATGNDLYVTRIDEQLRDWITSSLPYPAKKSSDGMWRGLEVSFRVKMWARIFFALQQDSHFLPATRLLLLTSLLEHAHYLRHFHGNANWVTMELTALATLGCAWPEFKESAAWLEYSKRELVRELHEQVYPDGVQKELAAHYHLAATNMFDTLEDLCKLAGNPLPEGYHEGTEKMWNYLAYSLDPKGRIPLNNDSDHDQIAESVLKAAERYQRQDWRYIATNGKEGFAPGGLPSTFFPWAGQLISRSGWDSDAHWSFFDIGPWGWAHQQQDHLHLSITAFGRDLLVDTGRFAYTGDLAKRFYHSYARQSRGHNVILIDDQGQLPGSHAALKPLGEESFRITASWDYAASRFGTFKGIEGIAEHQRAVLYLRGRYWIVLDRILTDRPRDISPLWHFHPQCTVRKEGTEAFSVDAETGNIRITPVGPVNWQMELIKGRDEPEPQGWYSPEYNHFEPCETAVYRAQIEMPTAFAWILRPGRGPVPAVRTEWLKVTADGVLLRIVEEEGSPLQIFMPFRDPSLVEIAN